MFLTAMCIMARASCITTHCPKLEDIKLPPSRHWDKDGLPKYVILGLRNWKSRKKENAGKLYPVKIHRNYLDPTYCPVFWLLMYLKHSQNTQGAVFQDDDAARKGQNLTDTQWIGMTDHWFGAAGLRVNGRGAVQAGADGNTKHAPAVPFSGCTNHSIRRSAAQWAGRCGAREIDVRNAGRWRSMQILAKYMAQGAIQREDYEDDEDGPKEDPIFGMFVFKKVTRASEAGQDIM
jgi:hypothetical protein